MVMPIFRHPMMFLTGGIKRINVDDCIGEVWQVLHELMPHVRGNGMPLGNRQLGIDGDIEFRMQPMPQPPGAHLGHLLHPWGVLHGVSDVRNNGWVHAV